MKITNLTVKNFKSFGTSTNPIDDQINGLNSINMIYGLNNSGKSNLLKFINLIFQPKTSQAGITVEGERMQTGEDIAFWKGPIINSPYIFHKNNREVPVEFEFNLKVTHQEIQKFGFSQFGDLRPLLSRTHDYASFSFKGQIRKVDDFDTAEMHMLEVSVNSKVIYSLDETGRSVFFEAVTQNNSLKGDAIAFSNLMAVFSNAALFLDNNRYLGGEVLSHGEIELSPGKFKNWFYHLYLNPKRHKIFEQLGAFIKKYKIAPSEVNADDAVFSAAEKNSPFHPFNPEFALLEDNNIEVMFKRGKERLPLSSFGTGVQQILYILTTLFSTNSRIILIEELELNLSPRYQKELFKILWALIDDGQIDQVFFTTHSSYFDHRTDFSIYEVAISSLGVSRVTKSTKTGKNTFFKKLD